MQPPHHTSAKAGGPDPVSNSALADVLRQARDAQVPKDIIERNIKKASEANQADFQEMLFEAYGPGGTGFLIECLSDNVNRSSSEVRSAVTKAGGKMAEQGSVAFNFKRQGVVMLQGEGLTEDQVGDGGGAHLYTHVCIHTHQTHTLTNQVFETAMEVGADDVQPVDLPNAPPSFRLLSSVEDFGAVRDAAQSMGLPVNAEQSGLVFIPVVEVAVDDEAYEANEAMMDRILSLDDVDAVYTTCAGLK